jgi:4-aminobutyrate aminotransferase/diaminobutyrate-pyruvate transaminase/4-aminobutyrate aminotransferase/(S)-3-amino-2-methylpropionate transaminase
MIGGIPELKQWIGHIDPSIYIVPFPNCYRCPCSKLNYENCAEECFSLIEQRLNEMKVKPSEICAVITESYQGGEALFAPKDYIRLLSEWCRKYEVLLVFDEVQSGFGRTGKLFAFEHYDVIPNLIACGKGITSSLPLSCVIGESRLLDSFEPGEMTSTHAANPVCSAAAIANIEVLIKENLVQKANELGQIMFQELKKIWDLFPDRIGYVQGAGLVWAVNIVKNGTKESDSELALDVVRRSIRKGLIITTPIGPDNATIKIKPPLTITENAIRDGALAFSEAIKESL